VGDLKGMKIKGDNMKKIFLVITVTVFALLFSSFGFAQECFTNHDCPDVDMNCVRGKCVNSIYMKGKEHRTENDEINAIIERKAQERAEQMRHHDNDNNNNSGQYFDTKSGRWLNCSGGFCQ
jgi:hypothetical protein